MNIKGKKMYVVYFDIVNSRLITNRKSMELKLNKVKLYINKLQSANPENIIKIEVWKGIDELLLMSESIEKLLEAILNIQQIMHPYHFRLVVSYTQIKNTQNEIRSMDSKVFAQLSDAMIRLKEVPANVYTLFSEKDFVYKLLFLNLEALMFIKSSFTDKQMNIYKLYTQGLNQQKIALKMKVSQQYVSLVLKQIKFNAVNNIECKLLNSANDF
jgi:DNA-binding NarL/FixJ family response regulator